MRAWMLPLLLYAVAAVGGDREAAPSSQFFEHVAATSERSSPDNCRSTVLKDSILSEWARSVAVLKVRSGTADAYGLGLVVGWEDSRYWIATAAHVVVENERSATRSSIKVFFPGTTSSFSICDDAPPKVTSGDLAFVCVKHADSLPPSNALMAARIEKGDKVRILGHPGAYVGSPRTGLLTGFNGMIESAGTDGSVTVLGLVGIPGQSGAPAISPRGIVGLYQGALEGGRVLGIKLIEKSASTARVPWSLTEYESFDCNFSRTVCAAAVAPGGAKVGLKLVRTEDDLTYRFENGDCKSVPEGKYEVDAASDLWQCSTTQLIVRGQPEPLRLREQCGLRLSGVWPSGNVTLACSPSQTGGTRCTGLGELGYGLFEGELTVWTSDVSISGTFNAPYGNPLPATGRLRVEGDALKGTISREGLPPRDIELRRQ